MPKVTAAERILETVTTSSRAASIVGDLWEEASNRSSLWFWLSVLRIFASHVWQDFRIHWLRMIWLGFSGFLKLMILGIAGIVTISLAMTFFSGNPPKFTPGGFLPLYL